MLLNFNPELNTLKLSEILRTNVKNIKVIIEDGRILNVAISIGVVNFAPNKESDIEYYVKIADDCLYKAKENGRNRVESKFNL